VRPLVRLFFVALVAAPVAAEVTVHVSTVPDARSCVDHAVLLATAAGSEPVRIAVKPGQSSQQLTLPPDKTWDVRVEADGCWSETLSWSDADAQPLAFELRRAATLTGRLEAPAEVRSLEGLLFLRKPGTHAGTRTHCTLQAAEWACGVPAEVPVDLRLDVPGYASVFYWGVIARARDTRRLEPRRLEAGGSIVGWVQTAAELPIAKARVTLYPLAAQTSGDDATKAAFRGRSTTTDQRGFFQLTGLEPGMYRLVSEASGLSAATIPEIRLRAAESVVWPRAITHVAPATLEIALSPPVDSDGQPWTIELAEKSPLHHDRKPPLRRPASMDGKWTAARLRADVHQLTVRSGSGSELEILDVDLTEGGPKFVPITVRSIAVRGVLQSQGEPLAAGLRFENDSGKVVRTETSDAGSFEAVFPATGTWVPTIQYPLRGRGSRLVLDPVEITGPENDLEIEVPGGRLHVRVTAKSIRPEQAAVHVLRDGKPVAQALVEPGGEFTFIGLKVGNYSIGAESEHAATPSPVEVSIDADSSREVEVVLEPYAMLTGMVVTPRGTPASGAVVRISTDDGRWWSTQVADAEGRFEVRSPAGVGAVELVILTYAFPAATVRVPPTQKSVVVTLKNIGGIVRVRGAPIPYIRLHTFGAPVRAFHHPEPFGRFGGGVHLEPGVYTVCPNRVVEPTCRSVTVYPEADVTIDFTPPAEKETSAP
jgi:hypothetical protein